MGFIVPNFNLTCNIFTGPNAGPLLAAPTGSPRVAAAPCALVFGRRVQVAGTGGTGGQGFPIVAMSLLLPALTDVRSFQTVSGFADAVEVPAGSHRWYWVFSVDDIGKGYPNEHRSAGLLFIQASWPEPIP